jgi:anthranilate/para-aminobenzoate synthase component I
VECGADSNRQKSTMPDAAMFLADRVVVVDHKTDDVYVLALFQDGNVSSRESSGGLESTSTLNGSKNFSHSATVPVSREIGRRGRLSGLSSLLADSYVQGEGLLDRQSSSEAGAGADDSKGAEEWVEGVVRVVKHLAQQNLHQTSERMHHVSLVSSLCTTTENVYPPFVAEKSQIGYMKDVKKCQEFIKDGESYEVCLTTQFRKNLAKEDGFRLYLTLRDTNPAPYSSWLHFGSDGPCICSSSPERFLQLDQKGVLEAKPIKGTTARGNTAIEDERLKYELQHR